MLKASAQSVSWCIAAKNDSTWSIVLQQQHTVNHHWLTSLSRTNSIPSCVDVWFMKASCPHY